MFKKEYIRYLIGITTMLISMAAIIWFFQNIDNLMSPKMVYIVRITCTIGFTISLTVGEYYGLKIMYQAIFLKERFDMLSTRFIWGSIGLVMVWFQYYAFDFPICLPRTIKWLVSTIFGDGTY